MSRLKPVEHKVKRALFRCSHVLLKKRRQSVLDSLARPIRKVLLLPPNRIGDIISVLPVADGLRALFPRIKISVLASPQNLDVIRDDPRFEHVFLYRKRPWRDVQEIHAMRRNDYDCVMDLTCADSVTGLYLSQLCAPHGLRVGVGKDHFSPYYDFSYPKTNEHILDMVIKSLDAFGVDSRTIGRYAPPFLDAESLHKADEFFAGSRFSETPGTMRIGYNLSAGAPTRHWQHSKVGELLLRTLAAYPESRVVLISVQSDRPAAEQLASDLGQRVTLIPEHSSIREVSAVIARLHILITPDTSLVHIGRSFQIPVVGLYTRCQWNLDMWRPYGQEHGTVLSGHEDNIFDISVDQVFDTLVKVVNAKQLVAR